MIWSPSVNSISYKLNLDRHFCVIANIIAKSDTRSPQEFDDIRRVSCTVLRNYDRDLLLLYLLLSRRDLCLQGRGGLGRGVPARPGERGGEKGEHWAQQGHDRRLLTGFYFLFLGHFSGSIRSVSFGGLPDPSINKQKLRKTLISTVFLLLPYLLSLKQKKLWGK